MNPNDEFIFEEENSEGRSAEDIVALKFLDEFICELILNFRKHNLSARTLMALSKALYAIENFDKLSFDGYFTIASGTRYDEGGSVSYEVTILSDEITFALAGSEYTEGVGSDSVYEEFYSLGSSDEPYNLDEVLAGWKENFYTFFEDGKGLSVSDQTENLESQAEVD